MFQQTFVTGSAQSRSSISIAVSLGLQLCCLAALMLAPLLIWQPLPTLHLRDSLLVAPDRPKAVFVPHQTSQPAAANSLRRPLFQLTAPVRVPTQINQVRDAVPEAPAVTTSLSAGDGNSFLSGLGDDLPGVAPPRQITPTQARPEAAPQPHKPLAVGGNVAAANLLQRVEPRYPPLAKAARVQGIVTFQAIIGSDGQIRNLQFISGHPLLVRAAETAIQQWRYRPTLLNGKPVEVLTTITVRFALAN